ncbi:MAG: C40 family peptidase, partial [Actinomycetota bacterium]|nr:C40 family peptidase [Actinomycetota bacterium]
PTPAPPPTPTPTSEPSPSPTPTPPAPEPPPAPAPPEPAPGAEVAIGYAFEQLNKPYEWGSDGPDLFDCSGFTKAAWRQAGVQLTHQSGAQYDQLDKVPLADAQRGDLLFYSTDGTRAGIYHVAIYLGDGQVIHSLRDWSSWNGVKVNPMNYVRGIMPDAGRP